MVTCNNHVTNNEKHIFTWNQYMHLNAVTQSIECAEVIGFGQERVLSLEIGQMPYEHCLSPGASTE